MNAIKILAIILIIAGSLILGYGGFTYTQDTHKAEIGSLELEVKEKETVDIPIWVGAGALAMGIILLFTQRRIGSP